MPVYRFDCASAVQNYELLHGDGDNRKEPATDSAVILGEWMPSLRRIARGIETNVAALPRP